MKTLRLSIIAIVCITLGTSSLPSSFSQTQPSLEEQLKQARQNIQPAKIVFNEDNSQWFGGPGEPSGSPLEQFKSGIPVETVTCKLDLLLIGKSKDASPACVKPDTAISLIKSGWGRQVITSEFVTEGKECGASFQVVNTGRDDLHQSKYLDILKEHLSQFDYYSEKFGSNWQEKIRISDTLWKDTFYVEFPMVLQAESFERSNIAEALQRIHSVRTHYFGMWCD